MDRIKQLTKEQKRMTVSAFIEDGYDETAFIKGVENLHPHVRITHRPLPVTERTSLSDQIAKAVNRGITREEDKLVAKVLSDRISLLEILNDDGTIAVSIPKPSADQLVKMRPALWLKVTAVLLWGTMPYDHDPFTGMEGKTVTNTLEDDQKN